MPIKAITVTATILAWNTSTGAPQTGDALNITPILYIDGAETAFHTPGATLSEVDATKAQGVYKRLLDVEDTTGAQIMLAGYSSTPNVVIIPAILYTEQGSLADIKTSADAAARPGDSMVASNIISESTIAAAVWDRLVSALTVVGSIGKRLTDFIGLSNDYVHVDYEVKDTTTLAVVTGALVELYTDAIFTEPPYESAYTDSQGLAHFNLPADTYYPKVSYGNDEQLDNASFVVEVV